ncbi:putative PEP-binding protein [Cylindrospermum sp. FACHB-282]|uniref:putative PEP-binding protein n=1 Tax=Cylindrospermum sp. FACHB-282 TaxID=2692794 RepID=UPI001683BAB0|nr:putative PEP-binding protein [Cylindrospermum sp. FACHB-282]MBD2385768.1 hypothetical protein [Cylindrospermum sp. FACHB-282]
MAKLIIHILDIGDDKPLPYLKIGVYDVHPLLDWRSIRLCLDYLDIFKTQLGDILQASTLSSKAVLVSNNIY